MRKTLLRVLVVTSALLLLGAATAIGLRLEVGNIVVNTDGGFSPTTLPKHEYAPITIKGHGKISTRDGALPPILETITFLFDKHGSVVTKGLPVCPKRKLIATTTQQARANCPGSIVGTGVGTAVINFEESAPIPASSPITIFNGPKKHGNPTVLAHAHLTIPAPTTFIVPVEIQRIHQGRYGYRTVAEIPKIANGAGTPISGSLKIGRKWTLRGQKMSYINASCPDGHLQAKGEFSFKDGTFLQGTFIKPCKGK
jgi:hypothetical protein